MSCNNVIPFTPQARKDDDRQSTPYRPVSGVCWMLDVLDDLVGFSDGAGLAEVRDELSTARIRIKRLLED